MGMQFSGLVKDTPIEDLIEWHVLSSRKGVTMRKLVTNRFLTDEQKQKMDLAVSQYEQIPLYFFAPYSLYMLRVLATMSSGTLFARGLLKLSISGVSLYHVAVYARDQSYWPTVVQVYKEEQENALKRKEEQNNDELTMAQMAKQVENFDPKELMKKAIQIQKEKQEEGEQK